MTESVIVAVTAPAVSFDLTTLATIKDDLRIPSTDTSSDLTLARYITEQSALAAGYCNRIFAAESLTETLYLERDPFPYQVPGGVRQLQLSRWPLLSVTSVTQNDAGQSTLLTPYPGTDPTVPPDYQALNGPGQLIRLDSFGEQMTWPAVMYVIPYRAGFIAPVDPWLASAAIPFGAVRANGGGLYLCTAPGTTAASGGPAGTGAAITDGTVTWSYVSAVAPRTLPYDLEMAVLRLVVNRFLERSRDPFLKRTEDPRVGVKEYWVGSTHDGPFPPEVVAVLDRYRVPVTA